MNVTLNQIDPVNATITIDVVKEDFAKEVEKNMKNLRKTAVVPGFRKGAAPLSKIEQIYGRSVLVEELNKLVSSKLTAYLQEEKLNILGDPLPSGDKETVEPGKESFSFSFDIGLAPQVELKLSKEDKVPYYSIEISDNMIDKYIGKLKASYGSYDNGEKVEERDLVKGVLTELDENGKPKANGILNENSVLMPDYIKDEEEKAKFTGAALDATIVFNPHKAFKGNTVELSSFLNVKKDGAENYTGNFSLTIKEIKRHKEAEINQELFDKIFEPGTVTTEEVFREKTKEIIAEQLIERSDSQFRSDVRKYLKEKAGEMKFPEAFLKRWLQTSSSSETAEEPTDADFRETIETAKYQLIKKQLIKDCKIKVTDDDILDAAEQAAHKQFARLGMQTVSAKMMENHIREMLEKEGTINRLVSASLETKLIDMLKEKLTVEIKTVTVEEFKNILSDSQIDW